MQIEEENHSFCKNLLKYLQEAFDEDDFRITGPHFNCDFPTMQYSQHSNELFIIEQNENKKFKLFLWIFNFDFIKIRKKREDFTINHTKYLIKLINGKNEEMDLNLIEFLPSFGLFLSSNNYNKTLVLANNSYVFVSRIGTQQKESNILQFYQISNFETNSIRKIKWMDSAIDNIAILTKDNYFMCFNVYEDLDQPEFSFNLGSFKVNKFVDFSFGSTLNYFDMSSFAIFFLNEIGDIYYLGPILLKNMIFPINKIAFLSEKVSNDKNLTLEIMNTVLKYCLFIKKGSIKIDENYILSNVTNEEIREFNNFAYFRKAKIYEKMKKNLKTSNFQLIYKLRNTMYHNFIRMDQKGNISILVSLQNIWFVNKIPFNLNKEEDFELSLIDKIRLRYDNYEMPSLIYPNDENKKYLIFFGLTLFELNLKWIENCEEKLYENFEFEYSNTKKNSNLSEILSVISETEQNSSYYGGLYIENMFLLLFKKEQYADMMLYPIINFETLEEIDNFNQKIVDIDSVLNEDNEKSLIQDNSFIKIKDPVFVLDLNKTLENCLSYTDQIDNQIREKFLLFMDRLYKLQEYGDNILKVNKICQESFLSFKKIIDKNDINAKTEKILEKNKQIKTLISNISQKFENFKGFNLVTKEYAPRMLNITEKFDILKSKFKEVKEKLKKDKLNKEIPATLEDKQKIEEIIKKIQLLKTKLSLLPNYE